MIVKEHFDRRRADKATESRATLDAKVEIIHKATNSMKDELVREVRSASFAAGEKSEKDKDLPRPQV